MHIDTRSAAENAATIAIPNEVTCGRGVASQRRLPFSFGADRPTGDELIRRDAATESGEPAWANASWATRSQRVNPLDIPVIRYI